MIDFVFIFLPYNLFLLLIVIDTYSSVFIFTITGSTKADYMIILPKMCVSNAMRISPLDSKTKDAQNVKKLKVDRKSFINNSSEG